MLTPPPTPTPPQIFRAAMGSVWAWMTIIIAIIVVSEAVLSWRTTMAIAALRQRDAEVQEASRILHGRAPALVADAGVFALTRDVRHQTTVIASRDQGRASIVVLRRLVLSEAGPGLVDGVATGFERLSTTAELHVNAAPVAPPGEDRARLSAMQADLDLVHAAIDRLASAEQEASDAAIEEVQQQRLVGLLAAGLVLAAVSLISARRVRHGQQQLVEAHRQLDAARARAEASATEAERVLAAMQAAEASYRTLFEGIDDAVIVVDAAGQYVDANPAASVLLGYSRDELLRLTVGALSANPADGRARFATLQREGRWRGEVDLRRKDGAVVPAEGWQVRIGSPDSNVFVAVWRDISERRALEVLQRDFLAMVTHELKSPLTTISAYAQYMRRRESYNEPAATAIVAQAQRLNRLIDDLLDVSRLAAGRLELQRLPVDLGATVQAAVEQARLLTPPHPITVAAPTEPVIAWCDRDRILQVLLNLLSNAVKYSPEGAPIEVRLEAVADQARIAVRDQGIGIAADDAARLFDRFYRSAAAKEQGMPGLGLGLAITQGLVEAHGGTIVVESVLGEGSTFTVTLPLTAPDQV